MVLGLGAALLVAGGLVVAEAGPAAAADITTACAGSSTTTFTLTADCTTTVPLTVPDGVTLDGGGFTISATDIGGAQWNGAIVTNAGASMNIQNVTITGPAGGFQLCTQATNVLYGILFLDASGTVNNVTVDHIYQQQNPLSPSCQTGRAIRAESTTAMAQTVTLTNTKVMDYQKTGFEARGSAMTMDISGSTAGPPHPLVGLIAQNGVTYVGAAGTIANNPEIWGSGDQSTVGPDAPTDGTAVLLFGATGVTVTRNTITGAGTDMGVAVANGSSAITVSFNQIGRTAPDVPDPTGHGVDVEAGSTATLTCNTYSGWNTNIVGTTEQPCPTAPRAPTILRNATSGNESATVNWIAPASDGGSPIVGYAIVGYIGYSPVRAWILSSPLTTRTVTGLTNGTTYRFRLLAYNAIGVSGYSKVTNPVTPTG
jgi:hypothetical protein